MINTNTNYQKKIGLILSGGGARAAYQVGVLTAISELLPKENTNSPFDIICGTSAGAFNACAMAARAQEFHEGVEKLSRLWSNFSCDQVYRTDLASISYRAWSVVRTIIAGKRRDGSEISLLDNTPLRDLINSTLKLHRIQDSINSGHLHALAISASGYTTGESVTFYQGAEGIQPWSRVRRLGIPAHITFEHLLASSAIPLVFPATKINREYFGDGAVRQKAPLSPALHLGADKILVVGVSANLTTEKKARKDQQIGYPSIAQIISHVMNSAFLDSFEGDIETLLKINDTVNAIPEDLRQSSDMMRPIDLLVIAPSQPIDEIAAKHVKSLPRTLRLFLHGTGATDASGASALSYLLFEAPFCRELITLGYHDTITRHEEVRAFLAR
jgi:NTE family protein